MLTWRLARRMVRCGGCGVRLDPDLPVLMVQIGGVRHAKYRCAKCAAKAYDETTPPDVGEPDVADVASGQGTLATRQVPRAKRPDWKQIAAKGDD